MKEEQQINQLIGLYNITNYRNVIVIRLFPDMLEDLYKEKK